MYLRQVNQSVTPMADPWDWDKTASFFTAEIKAAEQAGMLAYEEWLRRIFLKLARYRQRQLGGNHEKK